MDAATWKRSVTWACVGICLLFFGGLAAHGYLLLIAPCPSLGGADCQNRTVDWWALAQLSVGGGVAIGLIGFALSLANPRGVGWGLGVVVISALLFLIFVWPTPYKYYRDRDQQLIRVHRVTGEGKYIPDQRTKLIENTEKTQDDSASASQK